MNYSRTLLKRAVMGIHQSGRFNKTLYIGKNKAALLNEVVAK